jgi:hypothetical protein
MEVGTSHGAHFQFGGPERAGQLTSCGLTRQRAVESDRNAIWNDRDTLLGRRDYQLAKAELAKTFRGEV